MERLEIKVFDEIHVVDSLDKAIVIIERVLKEWFDSGGKKPLEISVNKTITRGPPSLEISVSDEVITKTAFG
jgi:hypothetical protein